MARPENNEAREQIRSAAFSLFREVGYRKTSYAAIAERCGMTRALVQYYFKKKELLAIELMTSVLDECVAALDAEGSQAATSGPASKIAQHVTSKASSADGVQPAPEAGPADGAQPAPEADSADSPQPVSEADRLRDFVKIGSAFFERLLEAGAYRQFLMDILASRELTESVLAFNCEWACSYLQREAPDANGKIMESVILSMGGFYELLYYALKRGRALDVPGLLRGVVVDFACSFGYTEKEAWKVLLQDVD